MRKILSILLALTFVLVALLACKPAEHDPASGEKPSKYSKGLEYEVNGNYCTITGIGSCKDTEIYIPEEINGKAVKKIANHAFQDNTTVTKIWLPDTITEIGWEAFNGCSNLKIINIPQSAETLGRRMFGGCLLDEFYCYSPYVNENKNSDFNIPKAKKIIYGGADWCTKISYNEAVEEVVLLDTVKFISFSECKNLKQVTIPDSVTYITKVAFSGCTKLTHITIPGSVKQIDHEAFSGSYATDVVLCEGVEEIAGKLGDYRNGYRYGAFSSCKINSISIPKSLKRIGAEAFAGSNLKVITYAGTIAEWEQIEKEEKWASDTSATVVHCTDGDVPIE